MGVNRSPKILFVSLVAVFSLEWNLKSSIIA